MPPIKRAEGQTGLVVVITDEAGNPLPVERATEIGDRFKNRLWVPLIKSDCNSTPFLEYALIDKVRMRDIEGTEFDMESFPEQMREILGSEIDIVKTLSTDYVENILTKVDGALENYQGSVRVFVGKSAPSAAELDKMNFETLSTDDENIKIHYKVCATTDFEAMIPLSWSFFQSDLHKIKVPFSVTELVNLAVGKNGSYSNRTTSLSFGSCSFVGPRTGVSASVVTLT